MIMASSVLAGLFSMRLTHTHSDAGQAMGDTGITTVTDAQIDVLAMTRHRFHGDWDYTSPRRHEGGQLLPTDRERHHCGLRPGDRLVWG
jgi:hypothetical protein